LIIGAMLESLDESLRPHAARWLARGRRGVTEGEHRAEMIVDRAYYKNGKRVRPGPENVEQAARLAGQADGFVWVLARDPSADELASLKQAFDLSKLAIDHAAAHQARPKLEAYRGRGFLALRAARYGDGDAGIEFGDIHVFVGPGYAVSIGRGAPADPAGAQERLEQLHPDLIAAGPSAVMWAILDQVLDGYEPVVSGIDDGIEKLEQQVFTGKSEATEDTYFLTRKTIEFHRAVALLENPVDSLVQGELIEIPEPLHRFLQEVGVHLTRIDAQVSSQREVLAGILDANLALISVRQNDVVQKISAWAAIIAVPTFFASIWGMNFTHMPELHLALGYPIALLVMLTVIFLLYRFFKRISWL
jgi:magnesium transporter